MCHCRLGSRKYRRTGAKSASFRFRRSGIGWFKVRSSSYWSRSSRQTSNRDRLDIVPSGQLMTRLIVWPERSSSRKHELLISTCAAISTMFGTIGCWRRDHAGIERIVLSQNPARLGELPQLERIDLAHGHAGCEQRAHDTTLVASASLKSDRRDRGAAQLLDQFGPAGGIVADRRALLLGQYHNVQTILRHIDAGEREHCHLRIPSLLMRARAQATVRGWKNRPELQAHSRTQVRSACGLPVATGVRS